MKSPLLAAAAFAAMSASSALADVAASDPAGVLKALGDLGYEAELKTGTEGVQSLSLTIDGSPSSIQFFNCDSARANCEALLFAYGMDTDEGVTLEKVNEWNSNTIHGFVYTDSEADPWLNLTLATGGGISDDLFAKVMRMWRVRIGDVRDFFDF